MAGLISLSITVSIGRIAFYTSYKNKDETISRTVCEFADLGKPPESLDKILQNRHVRGVEEAELADVEDSIDDCRDIIEELNTEVN